MEPANINDDDDANINFLGTLMMIGSAVLLAIRGR